MTVTLCLVPTGRCKEFYSASSCKDVTPGEGAVAECISGLLSAADAGEQGAGAMMSRWPYQAMQCGKGILAMWFEQIVEQSVAVRRGRGCSTRLEQQYWFTGR
jgi:hypothetical protein